MKVIVIDTSTEKSVVIFQNAAGEVQKKSLPSGFQSSTSLIEALDVDFEGVGLIAVTVGPGLMTGIRVGMAAAQGLSLGLGVPLVGISSFAGYASPDHVAVIDAKVRGAHIQEWGQKPRLIPLEELKSFDQIVGPNLTRIEHPNKVEREPDPKLMLEMALKKYQNRDYALQAQYQ